MYKNIKLKKGQLSKENNMPIRIVKNKPSRKGRSFRNTRRENRLEAERARTRTGKRNLREEKDRIRSELAVGGVAGVAGRRLRKNAHRPKGGPKAGGRKKYFKDTTRGGGPDSGNIGKIKDMLHKAADANKGLGKSPKSSLDDLRKKFKRKKPKYMKPLRAKYASGGAVMAGKKVGCQIK